MLIARNLGKRPKRLCSTSAPSVSKMGRSMLHVRYWNAEKSWSGGSGRSLQCPEKSAA